MDRSLRDRHKVVEERADPFMLGAQLLQAEGEKLNQADLPRKTPNARVSDSQAMHSYWCSPPPGEGGWSLPQPRTYTCLPVPLLLPPIQAHNFCSRPSSLGAGEWAAPREYHYFYGATAAAVPPWWVFPPAYAAALPPPPVLGQSLQTEPEARERWAPWPEGSSLQVELRWGHVEPVLGRRLQLPDFVRRELRRVYGTYPRTDARVTYRRGEFLLQGLPRVLEPEYHVERRVVRRPASGDSGGSGDGAPEGQAQELRRRRSKKKGLN